jgi:hypothetical protein
VLLAVELLPPQQARIVFGTLLGEFEYMPKLKYELPPPPPPALIILTPIWSMVNVLST